MIHVCKENCEDDIHKGSVTTYTFDNAHLGPAPTNSTYVYIKTRGDPKNIPTEEWNSLNYWQQLCLICDKDYNDFLKLSDELNSDMKRQLPLLEIWSDELIDNLVNDSGDKINEFFKE